MPTGGPADAEPPIVEETDPPGGSTDQIVDRITFTFNERLDERSVLRSLTIVPEFDRPPEIRARGKKLEVRFPEALRTNTTYVVTLDTNLKDEHGVALKQPITVAFGTGPSINRGVIEGRVVAASNGQALAGIDVLAYPPEAASSFGPEDRPDYRTQTDDAGRFRLSYLREQDYYVLAVRDRNGNRRLDPGEAVAVPPRASITADSSSAGLASDWVLAVIDDEPPRVQSVRARSNRELEIRFSEDVVLRDTSTTGWVLADSLSGLERRIAGMYADSNPRNIILRIDSLPVQAHVLSGDVAVADSAGNAMRRDTLRLIPSSAVFEGRAEFLGFYPDSLQPDASGIARIWPGIRAGVLFTMPPGDEWDALVAVEDTMGNPLPYEARTRDGRLYTLLGEDLRDPARISVQGLDTTFSRVFIGADASLLGELSGYVEAPVDSGRVVVELLRDDGPQGRVYRTQPNPDGRFRFDGLPGKTNYLLRAFVDLDGDGRWSPGHLSPYAPAEPIAWSTVQETIRARWETALSDTLRIHAE